eukprot:COSAG03_NODE_851_length_5634_cov_2.593315_4_plen_182_part_00
MVGERARRCGGALCKKPYLEKVPYVYARGVCKKLPISAEGVRYSNRRVSRSAFQKCMGRVPSDEKIRDDRICLECQPKANVQYARVLGGDTRALSPRCMPGTRTVLLIVPGYMFYTHSTGKYPVYTTWYYYIRITLTIHVRRRSTSCTTPRGRQGRTRALPPGVFPIPPAIDQRASTSSPA